MRLTRVVFPAPRNPVSTVSGTRPSDGPEAELTIQTYGTCARASRRFRRTAATPAFAPADLVVPAGPFSLAWLAGDGDVVRVLIQEPVSTWMGTANPDFEIIACHVEDSGAFTIPAALIAELDLHPFFLVVSRVRFTEVIAGAETIRFEVTSSIAAAEAE